MYIYIYIYTHVCVYIYIYIVYIIIHSSLFTIRSLRGGLLRVARGPGVRRRGSRLLRAAGRGYYSISGGRLCTLIGVPCRISMLSTFSTFANLLF